MLAEQLVGVRLCFTTLLQDRMDAEVPIWYCSRLFRFAIGCVSCQWWCDGVFRQCAAASKVKLRWSPKLTLELGSSRSRCGRSASLIFSATACPPLIITLKTMSGGLFRGGTF